MAASKEASMFIMFNMHVQCVHLCMHVQVCLYGAPPYTHTHPHTHPPTQPNPKGGDPRNQLKCYSTWTNQDISILFEDLKSV